MKYGSVYLIQMDLSFLRRETLSVLSPSLKDRLEAIKIGYTNSNTSTSSPETRTKGLQTGNPFELKLIAEIPCKKPQELEKYFHKKYQSQRILNEWFSLSQEQCRLICWEGKKFHETGKVEDEKLYREIMAPMQRTAQTKSGDEAETKETSDDEMIINPRKEHVQRILCHYRQLLTSKRRNPKTIFNMDREYLERKDFEIVRACLDNHKDAQSKVGVGVEGIFVKKSCYGSFCFHVKRTDGSEEDFSYLACFSKTFNRRSWYTHKTPPIATYE